VKHLTKRCETFLSFFSSSSFSFYFLAKLTNKKTIHLHLFETLIEVLNPVICYYPELSRLEAKPIYPLFDIIWSSFFHKIALNQFVSSPPYLETFTTQFLPQKKLSKKPSKSQISRSEQKKKVSSCCPTSIVL